VYISSFLVQDTSCALAKGPRFDSAFVSSFLVRGSTPRLSTFFFADRAAPPSKTAKKTHNDL